MVADQNAHELRHPPADGDFMELDGARLVDFVAIMEACFFFDLLGISWGFHGIFSGISWKFKMGHERTFFACLTMWHLPSK